MTSLSFTLEESSPAIGLIVLQSDETIETEFRTIFSASIPLYHSRIPSAPEVTPETLIRMEKHLAQTSALFPLGGLPWGYWLCLYFRGENDRFR